MSAALREIEDRLLGYLTDYWRYAFKRVGPKADREYHARQALDALRELGECLANLEREENGNAEPIVTTAERRRWANEALFGPHEDYLWPNRYRALNAELDRLERVLAVPAAPPLPVPGGAERAHTEEQETT